MKRRIKGLSRVFNWMVDIFVGYFFFHNFVKPHWGLSIRSSKNWIEIGVAPAIVCGITIIQFSLYGILAFSPTLD